MKSRSTKLSTKWLFKFVRAYQWVRVNFIHPWMMSLFGFSSQCIYPESCSRYALRISREYATIPAIRLIVARVLSCHGWHRK